MVFLPARPTPSFALASPSGITMATPSSHRPHYMCAPKMIAGDKTQEMQVIFKTKHAYADPHFDLI